MVPTKYTPYGITYDLEGGEDEPFEFNLRQPGQYFDAETGFYYNGMRYYIPEMRRYNRPEPIGQAGSLDLYMYAGGNPVNRIDPTGLADYPAAARATAGIIGNSLGIISGVLIGSTGAATFGLTTAVGGTIAFKSGYGLSANIQNLAAAIRDVEPVSKGNVFNDTAEIAAPGNKTAQGVATAADLAVDLATIRGAANVVTPDVMVKGSVLLKGGTKLGPMFEGQADTLLKIKVGVDVVDTLYQTSQSLLEGQQSIAPSVSSQPNMSIDPSLNAPPNMSIDPSQVKPSAQSVDQGGAK